MQWGLAASKARLLSLWSLSNCCTFNWHVSSEQNQCCGCFAAKSFWCFVSLWHFAFIVIFTCLMLTFHPPSPEDGFSTWKCSLTLSSSCNAFVFKSAILDFIKMGFQCTPAITQCLWVHNDLSELAELVALQQLGVMIHHHDIGWAKNCFQFTL